jgi:hypothetical protein
MNSFSFSTDPMTIQPIKQWIKDTYLISTDPLSLQPLTINEAFASDEIVWTNSMDLTVLQTHLNNSICFGLYLNGPENTSNPILPPLFSTPSHTSSLPNSNRSRPSHNRPRPLRLPNRCLRPPLIPKPRIRTLDD